MFGESVRGCAAFRFYFKLWRKELVYLFTFYLVSSRTADGAIVDVFKAIAGRCLNCWAVTKNKLFTKSCSAHRGLLQINKTSTMFPTVVCPSCVWDAPTGWKTLSGPSLSQLPFRLINQRGGDVEFGNQKHWSEVNFDFVAFLFRFIVSLVRNVFFLYTYIYEYFWIFALFWHCTVKTSPLIFDQKAPYCTNSKSGTLAEIK